MEFFPGFEPDESSIADYFLIFCEKERNIVVNQEGNPFLSLFSISGEFREKLFIGTLDDMNCFAFFLKHTIDLPPGLEWADFKTVYRALDGERQFPLSRGKQLLEWKRTHRFCGSCGTKTVISRTEYACHCPGCNESWYPVIAPAVIVRITRGDEILLAHNVNFPEGLYSHIAGFVDSGETVEQTLRREIREEVGLDVDNIQFFDSQSWPMPHSLMLAFTAECTDPDAQPQPDGTEITDAQWFTRDTLPELPPRGSIAGRMMMDYIENTVRK